MVYKISSESKTTRLVVADMYGERCTTIRKTKKGSLQKQQILFTNYFLP